MLLKNKLTGQLTCKRKSNMNMLSSEPIRGTTYVTSNGISLAVSTPYGAKLEALKTKLIEKLAAEFFDLRERLVRRAVEEAAALVSLTAHPLLLLPTLDRKSTRLNSSHT